MKKIVLPSADSRAVFVGKTGCGKTTLAERVCAQFDNVCVLDSKGELTWKGYAICESLQDVFRSPNPKIIWRPNPHEQNEETYDRYFKWIYERRNTVCYVDEIYAICKNSQHLPFHFKAILTRGRSRNVASFNATQAPTHVPHFILSQAEYYFVFALKLDSHREKIEDITGIPKELIAKLPNYDFYYADDNSYFPRKLKLRIN